MIAASYAWIIGMATGMMTALIITLWKYKNIAIGQYFSLHRDDIKTWLHYAVRVFIGANVGTLFGQIDQLMIVSLG